MFSRVFSASPVGVRGALVEIETTLRGGTPCLHVTGLPGGVIKESREKVRGCLEALGYKLPSRRAIVHLYPAELRKEGSQFDLGITLTLLAAEGYIEAAKLETRAVLGELSLDGKIRSVAGATSLIGSFIDNEDVQEVIVPKENQEEASLLGSSKIRLAEHVSQVVRHFKGGEALPECPQSAWNEKKQEKTERVSLDNVLGQSLGKRALCLSVAGRHHLLLSGPPGVGKSLLAQCAPGLLPSLSRKEQIAVKRNFGLFPGASPSLGTRPFRSPHHTSSAAAILGGGSGSVLPGEVTLADQGVLFLDELPEFRRDVIEGLREPLESGEIHIHRQGRWLTFPSRFCLIAAMNPCPCGFAYSDQVCRCSDEQLVRYQRKTSGPLMDRVDLLVRLNAGGGAPSRPSQDEARSLIARAVRQQIKRFGSSHIRNGDVSSFQHEDFKLSDNLKTWIEGRIQNDGLSHRSKEKIIRVARTIADTEGSQEICEPHLKEAFHFKIPEQRQSSVPL